MMVNCDQELLNSWGLSDINLRQYQIDGVNWFLQCINLNHGGILSDEMGLGKTIQTISTIIAMRALFNFKKFIIISPLSVITNWKTELSNFAKNLTFVIYMGGKTARTQIRATNDWNLDELIILTTYEYVIQDIEILSKIAFNSLFIDEGHRIKNCDSVLYGHVKEMNIKYKFLLTGTPIQNNLDEFYNLLIMVAPNNPILSSRTGFKKLIEKKLSELKSTGKHMDCIMDSFDELKQLVLRRTKSEVLQHLPDKKEVILFHGLTKLQKTMYKSFLMKDNDVLKKVLTNRNSNVTETKKLMNILMQVRKCVLHPYLFDGIEEEPFVLGEHIVNVSQKMTLLDKLLKFLLKRQHKVLIFSQMTKMLDIIQDYCTLRGYAYERLDGSVRSEERFAAITKFGSDINIRIFLLSTRAGGQGLNLTAADTVVFVDNDFNPQMDLQAMARIHRPGQTRPCRTIRLVGKNCVEEMIVWRAAHKLELTRGVLGHEDAKEKDDKKLANIKELVCFGIDQLFDDSNDDNDDTKKLEITDDYLTSILGDTDELGCWQIPTEKTKEVESSADDDVLEPSSVSNISSMYLFEGTDYSSKMKPNKKDYEKVIELLNIDAADIADDKNDPNKYKPIKISQGRQIPMNQSSSSTNRSLKKLEKKKKLWQDHGYMSLKLTDELVQINELVSDNHEFENDSSVSVNSEDQALHYVVGDVTQPITVRVDSLRIVCHVVDNSGSWGSGGVFSAIDRVNPQICIKYMEAFEMEDLQLGDCHIIPFTRDIELALMIAQKRDVNDRVSPIQMTSLEKCLSYVARYAQKNKASVHLPRIGYKTPQFNWYGVERLISKELVRRSVETYIYYYRSGRSSLSQRRSNSLNSNSISSPTCSHTDNVIKTTEENGNDDQTSFEQPIKKQRLSSKFFSEKFRNKVFFIDDNVTDFDRNEITQYIYAGNGEVCKSRNTPELTHLITSQLTAQSSSYEILSVAQFKLQLYS